MKKSLIATLFLAFFTLCLAQAQKPQLIKTVKPVQVKPTPNVEVITVKKQQGISIIILEESASSPCDPSKSSGVSLTKFAASPNTPIDNNSKGLDASIEQCCSMSTTGTFQLRTSFVDCNGLTITTRRTIDVATACSKKSGDLMSFILASIGTPPKGTTYKVKAIKVWQN